MTALARSLRSILIPALIALLIPARPAQAQERVDEAPAFENTDAALAALRDVIECKGRNDYDVIAGALVDLHFAGSPGPAFAGWTEEKQDNPFVYAFRLPRPVEVFGHATQRILIAGRGISAILPASDHDALVSQLNLVRNDHPLARHIHSREVDRAVEGEGAFAMTMTTRLTVSRINTHPDAVLAGCEYAMDAVE